MQVPLNGQLAELGILSAAQPVGALEEHLRALLQYQLAVATDLQIAVDQHRSCPADGSADPPGPARLSDIHRHRLAPWVHGQLSPPTGGGRDPLGVVGGIGSPSQSSKSQSIEWIGAIAHIAGMVGRIGRIVGPEVQIVSTAHSVGDPAARVSGIPIQPVGADQIHLLGLFVVVVATGDRTHVPHQQTLPRQMAIVECPRARALLQQQVLLLDGGPLHQGRPQGYSADEPVGVQIRQHQARGIARDLHQPLVVRTDPAQFLQTPGAEGIGAVVAVPAVRPPAHQTPAANAGAVLFRRIALEVIEIGQPEVMTELVGHRPHGLGKGAFLLDGPMAGNADGIAIGADVPGDVRLLQPQTANACGAPDQEVRRDRQRIDEDVVHHAVVIP